MGQSSGHAHRHIRRNVLFNILQKIIPQHFTSRLVGRIASSKNHVVKTLLIHLFKTFYKVSLANAKIQRVEDYNSFNEFFTREITIESIKDKQTSGLIFSPAEGMISQIGEIRDEKLIQAKGHSYSLAELSGLDIKPYAGGSFITIYLSPSNYHRVHLPISATLKKTVSIPGALYSVNTATERSIPNLFCKNERLVCQFESERGPILVILVGALIVASIEMDWEGPASPYLTQEVTNYSLHYTDRSEIGKFLLGSTVICCFPPNHFSLDQSLSVGKTLKVCSRIGSLT